MNVQPLEKMRSLKPGHHACMLYDGQEDLLGAVVPFLQGGLARGERCVYLSDPLNVLNVRDALAAAGTKVTRETERGALILMSERTHLVNGLFEPSAMIRTIERLLTDSLAAGFTGLCGAGDAMWEQGSRPDLETFLRYEATLDGLFEGRLFTALCLYRRQSVPPGYLGRALETHGVAVFDGHVCMENRYHNPSAKPGRLLDDPFDADTFQTMCENLRKT
jgi:chemotaxis family two-component system sensor kinase Cph1